MIVGKEDENKHVAQWWQSERNQLDQSFAKEVKHLLPF